jgi:isochorismate synthase EntC
MFITLTDIVSNKQIRLNVAQIIGYTRNVSNHDGEEYTAIYLHGKEPGVVFVGQSPEQLDALMGECFITVKGEMK